MEMYEHLHSMKNPTGVGADTCSEGSCHALSTSNDGFLMFSACLASCQALPRLRAYANPKPS